MRNDAVIAAADRGAGPGRQGKGGAGKGIVRVDAEAGGAGGDIAVGGDGQRARAGVLRPDAEAVATDRGAGAGGHGEIGGGGGISRVDALEAGADDIAVGGDGRCARAAVEHGNPVCAAHGRAGAGGHADTGAGGEVDVAHVNPAGGAAGDIAVGDDRERACVVGRINPAGAAGEGAIGDDGKAGAS